jgi:hypothetical protein
MDSNIYKDFHTRARFVLRAFFIGILIMTCCWFLGKVNGLVMVDFGKIPVIEEVQSQIKPLIREIIKQELGLTSDDSFPQFLIKPRHNLTLYYLDGYDGKSAEEAFVVALEKMQKMGRGIHQPKGVHLTSEAAFFGDRQDELVLKVTDQKHALQQLHNDIKNTCNKACYEYKHHQNKDLYNVLQSERFPYVPHIAIGRLQLEYLSKTARRSGKNADFVIQNIKKRIEREVFPKIAALIKQGDTELLIHRFTLKTRGISKIFELRYNKISKKS